MGTTFSIETIPIVNTCDITSTKVSVTNDIADAQKAPVAANLIEVNNIYKTFKPISDYNGIYPDNKTKLCNECSTITAPSDTNAITLPNINIVTTTPTALIYPGFSKNVDTGDHTAANVAAPCGIKADTPSNVDINV